MDVVVLMINQSTILRSNTYLDAVQHLKFYLKFSSLELSPFNYSLPVINSLLERNKGRKGKFFLIGYHKIITALLASEQKGSINYYY